MRKIQILFYKARIDGKILDNAIAGISGLWPYNWNTPPYSHVEMKFCNRWWTNLTINLAGQQSGTIKEGVCFSSASRGGQIGVRFAPASEVLKNPNRWDAFEAEIPDELERALFDECQKYIGLGYDYIGCLAKITPYTNFIQQKSKWFCSEIVDYVLYKTGFFGRHNRLSPRAFYRKLKQVPIFKFIEQLPAIEPEKEGKNE